MVDDEPRGPTATAAWGTWRWVAVDPAKRSALAAFNRNAASADALVVDLPGKLPPCNFELVEGAEFVTSSADLATYFSLAHEICIDVR